MLKKSIFICKNVPLGHFDNILLSPMPGTHSQVFFFFFKYVLPSIVVVSLGTVG